MKASVESKPFLRYCSFSARDYLILKYLPIDRDISVMEIGVGLASMVDKIVGKVKEYCGVDIAPELVNYLTSLYKHINSVSWVCLDACHGSPFFNKQFDVVFSADTLEHVDNPQGFFCFIKKHLNPRGIALIAFPNESQIKHHGLVWFDQKRDLFKMIDGAGLEVLDIFEVKPTIWHKFIRKILWKFPKSLIVKTSKLPQTFAMTEAFKTARSAGAKTYIFALYAKAITRLAVLFPPYKYLPIGSDITNKKLFIRLKHK